MREFTTPTIPLKVKGVDLTTADAVYVTFTDSVRGIVITKDSPTLTVSGSDTNVTVTLSQAETGQFGPKSRVDIEVNWMKNGMRGATEIGSVTCFENLLKEVIT